MKPSATTDSTADRHLLEQRPQNVGCFELARSQRLQRDAVGDGGHGGHGGHRIVDQSFAFEDHHQPVRQSGLAGHGGCRDRIGRGEDGTQNNGRCPAQPDEEVADYGDHTSRHQGKANGQQRDGPQVAPEHAQWQRISSRRQQRQEDEQHHVRRHADYRQGRDQVSGCTEADTYTGEDDGRRHPGARHDQRCRQREAEHDEGDVNEVHG
jgi:hypothetical protein